MRLVWIFVGLAILFLIPFLIWGGPMERTFSIEGAVAWLRGHGRWAWLAGVILLMSDLLLPIPGTAVMAALGLVYGPIQGGLLGALGAFLGGQVAYGLCRMIGRQAAVRMVGERDLARGEQLFRKVGGWLVAWSRWMPLLPEVIACMAGLTRMPWLTFSLALLCGCLPMGLTFAAVGHAGIEHPRLAIALSALLPPLLWLVVQFILRSHTPQPPLPPENTHPDLNP